MEVLGLENLAKKKKYKVWVKSSTDQIHNISVQGPNSRKILEKFVWTPPAQVGHPSQATCPGERGFALHP